MQKIIQQLLQFKIWVSSIRLYLWNRSCKLHVVEQSQKSAEHLLQPLRNFNESGDRQPLLAAHVFSDIFTISVPGDIFPIPSN